MPQTPDDINNLVLRDPEPRSALDDGVACPLCHLGFLPEVLDDPDATYLQVTSWVTGAKMQSPVLRTRTGRRAHKDCVEKLVNGQAPDQQRIPGLET